MPFNLSLTHMVVVAIVALVVLGPERLPNAARTAGSLFREWRRVSGGLQAEVRDVFSEYTEPFNEALNDIRTGPTNSDTGTVTEAQPAPGASAPPAPFTGESPAAPAIPALGPSSGLVSVGPALSLEIPPLAPAPAPGTFVPHPEAGVAAVSIPDLRDPGVAPSP